MSSALTRYAVPTGWHEAELTIDRSRFRCTIDRVATPDDGHALVQRVRQLYPDATHHCWAFIAGPPASTSRIGLSDDGEPHGTAGRPMLTVLLHSAVGEIGAVVTRWYGGTKLGTGGLVRAYSAAVQEALASLPTRPCIALRRCTLRIPYAQLAACRLILEAAEAQEIAETFGEAIDIACQIPDDRIEGVQRQLQDLTRGQAVLQVDAPRSC